MFIWGYMPVRGNLAVHLINKPVDLKRTKPGKKEFILNVCGFSVYDLVSKNGNNYSEMHIYTEDGKHYVTRNTYFIMKFVDYMTLAYSDIAEPVCVKLSVEGEKVYLVEEREETQTVRSKTKDFGRLQERTIKSS